MQESRRSPIAYYLAAHVYGCVSAAQLILVDVKRSRYLGFSAAAAYTLKNHVEDWPRLEGLIDPRVRLPVHRLDKLLKSLKSAGMITGARSTTRATLACVPPPQTAFVRERPGVRVPFDRHDVGAVLRASLRAARDVHLRSFAGIIEHVRDLKARKLSDSSETEERRLRSDVAKFQALRPLLFRVRNNCLYDSMALLEYLSPAHRLPIWVIGIRTGPFAAHSWLQEGSIVYNDEPDNVRQYLPILTL